MRAEAELVNLALFFLAIGKTALYTLLGAGMVAAFLFERYPLLQSRGLQLLADWRMRARNGRVSQETVGNRVSPPRTAQRREDDLTNAGAPWERVEASQRVSGGRAVSPGLIPANSQWATSRPRKGLTA